MRNGFRLLRALPLLLALSAAARAQTPIQENVVVSASLSAETAPAVTASVTVLTRDEIEKSGATEILELLREVPGVDVVRIGGEGKVASVFLRGANSTQALVLVDGVRVNRPDFAGYDFSALSTERVERIEVARGPFSALYGSDAIGGVISIITRRAAAGLSGRATAAAGNRSTREETLFATAGEGALSLALSGRDARDGGEAATIGGTRVDHDAWRDTNGSVRVDWTPTDGFRLGAAVERLFARTEIPESGALATPRRRTDLAQSTWTLPVSWQESENASLAATVSRVDAHPTFSDPDDPYGYTASDTFARTDAVRVVQGWKLPGHALSAAASYERSRVDLSDSFGVELAGERVRTWGIAAEDQVSVGDSLLVVAGVRYDRHSTFGDTTNPRVSVAWKIDGSSALRAAFGTAFRAPSIGELFYPYSGNPDLKPEKSRSGELGWNLRRGAIEADIAVFRNDVRDLIQYDFATNSNGNVGRARTEGAEASFSAPIAPSLRARLSYTYLRARDEAADEPLLRRPRHRGSFGLSYSDGPWQASGTLLFVGRRADVDAATFARVEDPSFARVDAFVRYSFGSIAPFVRLTNVTDRRYAEASGFPAPRRRVMAGLEARF
jgi:vitamin B12 transporter